MNPQLEVLLFRLYYKIPFLSYQQKRKFILLIHRYFNFLTKNTNSYQIHQMTARTIENKDQSRSCFSESYSEWIKKYDCLPPEQLQYLQKALEMQSLKPLVSIVMLIQKTEAHLLRPTIESIIIQSYPNWELYIIGNSTIKPSTYEIINEYIAHDDRIKLAHQNINNYSIAFNKVLERIKGDFLAFITCNDRLAPHAILWILLDIIHYPEGMLWYSDEDKINDNGKRKDPYFKPDWNPDLLLSCPCSLLGHLCVYRTSLVRRLNGFRPEYENVQEYDLALRAIELVDPTHIRHIPRILYHRHDSNEKVNIILDAALKSVNDYLNRRGIKAHAGPSPENLYIRIRYQLPERLPLVTLIIPTHNGFKLLSQCIESIIRKTDYLNYEIIVVNNNSDDPSTLNYLKNLSESRKAIVLNYPHPFNYSAINNMAAACAHGELIGFLNDDVEIINDDWLTEMVSHALRPEIGAVGARLWYKNNTLQHGGVILGINGVANHAHKGFSKGNPGYFGRAVTIQNFSAITGACLVLRKDCFIAVGGFNEQHLAVTFNDVDLCLKLIKSGLRILWTPYAELYHYESASRGYDDTVDKIIRSKKEIAYMHDKWKEWLISDPAYNPNLTLETEDFSLAWPPRQIHNYDESYRP